MVIQPIIYNQFCSLNLIGAVSKCHPKETAKEIDDRIQETLKMAPHTEKQIHAKACVERINTSSKTEFFFKWTRQNPATHNYKRQYGTRHEVILQSLIKSHQRNLNSCNHLNKPFLYVFTKNCTHFVGPPHFGVLEIQWNISWKSAWIFIVNFAAHPVRAV